MVDEVVGFRARELGSFFAGYFLWLVVFFVFVFFVTCILQMCLYVCVGTLGVCACACVCTNYPREYVCRREMSVLITQGVGRSVAAGCTLHDYPDDDEEDDLAGCGDGEYGGWWAWGKGGGFMVTIAKER